MTDRVFIEGLTITAAHGVHDRERRESQEFILDISIAFDIASAARSDALTDTYDYGMLRAIARDVFAGTSNYLIERLASRIAEVILKDLRVIEVMVTIRKPHAYPDCIPGISITRTRTSV